MRSHLAAAAVVTVLWIAGLGSPDSARAQGFYRYIDADGTVHFTNVPPSDGRFQRVSITPRGVRRGRIDLEARPPVYHRLDETISRVAQAYGVQPGLVKAVIAAESNFDHRARSRKGAMGLMQLMPATARDMGISEPYEPLPNILGGTRYLRRMLDRYGDVSRALAAYNAGPTAVDRYRGIPPYRETQDYVARVLDYYRSYDREFRRPDR
ncbi:MAG: lytic transglycosylase domain-containing protein [Myxococcota bacterium]